MKTLAVVGLGYIGLPTAVVFAQNGWNVVGVDVSSRAVDAVNAGRLHFVEEGLEDALREVVSVGTLTAQTEMPVADVYVVAVPTPFKGDHEADLSYIDSVADSIAPILRGGELVILESTSPPGTTAGMANRILDARTDLSLDGADDRPTVHFAHAPERVLPGRIMVELIENDRIIGGLTDEATRMAVSVYKSFCEGSLLETTAATAELAKLTENSYRDVNIAFANELSLICDELGINVWELIELANHHPRVNILQPGPGVGGHCIAVDPWFIVSAAPETSRLIRTAREVNDAKPNWVLDQIKAATSGLESPTVAMLGLAFKPNIDDLRESPAVTITANYALENPNVRVLTVEPHITSLPERLKNLKNVELSGIDQALDADVIVVLVEHEAFLDIPRARIIGKRTVDTKGLWA